MTKAITHHPRVARSNGTTHDGSISSMKSLLTEARTALGNVGGHASEDLQALRDRLRTQVTAMAKSAAKAARQKASQADDVIRAKPYHAIGIAALLGLVAGLLIARRRSAA
jgi:ElaB/YqjD/DUF883 family membrane-anchored ribosome-binding protein